MKDSPQDSLAQLAFRGSVAEIKRRLADSKLPVSKADLDAALPIALYSRKDSPAEVSRLFLERGANPEQRQSVGTLLMGVSMNGKLPLVKLLIEFGADPNRFFGRETALSAALDHDETEIVEYLESLGAKVDPDLALHRSAQYGDLPRVKRALSTGADINAVTGKIMSGTPLSSAADNGEVEMVKFLLAQGADPQKRVGNRPPLHYAASGDNALAVVEVLIAAGCKPDSHYYEETPLMVVAREGDLPAVKRLVELGANPRARNSHSGMTVLDYARKGKNKAIVAYLSAAGVPDERAPSRALAAALKRVLGGSSQEEGGGIFLKGRFRDHKCQAALYPQLAALYLDRVRYLVPGLGTDRFPVVVIGHGKPPLQACHQPTKLASAASKQLGLQVYSSLSARDPAQKPLAAVCRLLAPALRRFALAQGEFLVFGRHLTSFAWSDLSIESSLSRLEQYATFLTAIVRAPQADRRLFEGEWLLKPAPSPSAGSAPAPHLFGGTITPPIACPHCSHAANPIIRIDLTDPSLPRTPLPHPSLPVTWCFECGEWDATFHDISRATPVPRPAAGKAAPTAVLPAATSDLPPRPMVLVPLPAGKKAGRKSKLGGAPSWVQSDDTPDCPACTKPMAFVLQMASDSKISYADMGILYAFACPECRILASLIQSH